MAELTREQYFREEKANAITHGLGLLMGLVGTPVLLYASYGQDAWSQRLGLLIFGISMILLYLSSTLYHSVHQPDWKLRFRQLDHISIYFLIAGTHTPFVLYYLEGTVATRYLLILWGLTFLGVLHKVFFFGKWNRLSVIFYLILGWMVVPVLPDMIPLMGEHCFTWILTGGVLYTVGVVFFLLDSMPFNHAIWHLFVMGGTLSHFIAVYYSIGK